MRQPRRIAVRAHGRIERRLSANVSFEHGEFYSRHRTSVSISRGRF